MDEKHERRILIVEDDSVSAGLMRRSLQRVGYRITIADSYARALEQLNQADFHLAILDVCLDGNLGVDEGGLRVLDEIKKRALLPIMPVIVLTRFSNEARAVRSLQELGASLYLRKEGHYVRKLRELLPQIFQDKIKINFDLQYVGDALHALYSCAQDIHATEEHWPNVERIQHQMRDLMGRLFANADEIRLRKMEAGLSGSAILGARPLKNGNPAQWAVIKIARRAKIEQEQERYEKYVQDYLPAHRVSLLRSAFSQHLGAILYTLANLRLEQVGNFGDFYRRETPARIEDALQHLFRETCEGWYRGRKPSGESNLVKLYLEAFELESQPERLPNEIASLRPGFERQQDYIDFPALDKRLPNPLRFLDDLDAITMPVARCITHGDLHAGNILIDNQGECWLIDFYRTHESHVLRDIVKLEVDIKFNLMPALDPETFIAFEMSLLRWDKPKKRVSQRNHAELAKAFAVINALRGEAHLLLDSSRANATRQIDIEYEYLLALLMTTLNVLRLRHYKETLLLQPYRELALLSACLICLRLNELNKLR